MGLNSEKLVCTNSGSVRLSFIEIDTANSVLNPLGGPKNDFLVTTTFHRFKLVMRCVGWKQFSVSSVSIFIKNDTTVSVLSPPRPRGRKKDSFLLRFNSVTVFHFN